ncbi:cystathionine beta-lyase [Nannochloropsis oceanica]
MASASPPHAATPTGPEAPPSTDKGNDKHSIILQGGLGTRLTHLSRPSGHCFVNPPVQRGSTVLFPTVKERNASWFERKRFEQALTYGINGSETHHMLEDMVANIEGGTRSQITSSGLSACTIALLAYTKAGDHVLLPDSIYGPVRGFAEGMLRRFHVDVEYYHASATGTDVAALLKENTTVVYIESPGSHTFEVVDVKAIASVARNHGAKSILDNTYGIHFFRPFEKGNVDISVQALTKYVVGHSDALLGAITVNTRENWEQVRQCVLELGEAVSPDDCWLAIRGARTLGVRLKYQMEAGLEVARYLSEAFPQDVVTVLHPAFPSCPGHDFYLRDYTGCCSLFSVVFHPMYSEEAMHAMLDSYRLFAIGASWGGFESLVLPTTNTITRSIEPAFPSLVGPTARFHVGLEEVEDLKADLRRGIDVLKAFDNGGK